MNQKIFMGELQGVSEEALCGAYQARPGKGQGEATPVAAQRAGLGARSWARRRRRDSKGGAGWKARRRSRRPRSCTGGGRPQSAAVTHNTRQAREVVSDSSALMETPF